MVMEMVRLLHTYKFGFQKSSFFLIEAFFSILNLNVLGSPSTIINN